jgi:hypothetical protein
MREVLASRASLVPCWWLLLAIAICAPADAQPSSTDEGKKQKLVIPPDIDHEVELGRSEVAGSSREALLSAIERWLSSEFALPVVHEHPIIEFAPPAKMSALRVGLLSDPGGQVTPNDRASSAPDDTVAIYYDARRTIYLLGGWTGGSPAEISVLVHEVVHHFQNVLGLKHDCPQDREKLAYLAQERWLALFGHTLESDFHIDPFSLFAKTKCFY